jgi:AcrR family transcriptional regulator/DNA-binding MarR family transcriptional regulator
VVDRYGYSDTTVSYITERARVSRRTFYELFANREDCLAAMFEQALEQIGREIAAAGIAELPWRERIRGGLLAILSFFDREPVLARVLVVQSLRGDERVLERRAAILAGLASAIDEIRQESGRARDVPPLTAEGVVGAAHAIVYDRLFRRTSEPLTGLLNGLMGMIVLPYLGQDASRREQARETPKPALTPVPTGPGESPATEADALRNIPMRVTYRTARVLERIGEQPGISNREVADQAGISDQGQMSKLLSRLERFGLIANSRDADAKGEANVWTLTQTGIQVAQSILVHTPRQAGLA